MHFTRSIFLWILLFSGSNSFYAYGAGADVNEAAVTVHRYVDVNSASGTENGSMANPWKTLAQGFSYLNSNPSLGVKLHIADGMYREGGLSLSERSGVAVIEGESRGGVVISGSDVWTGWTSDGAGNWFKSWPQDWGLGDPAFPANPESDLGRRNEMVF